MTSRTRSYATISLFVLSFALNGCAAVLAGSSDGPDTQKLHVGAKRTVVEQELGEPLTEMHTTLRDGGDKRCTYKAFVREKPDTSNSTFHRVANTFVGFHAVEYEVIYDRNSRAISIRPL